VSVEIVEYGDPVRIAGIHYVPLDPEHALALLDALGEEYGNRPPEHWNPARQASYVEALRRLHRAAQGASA